MSILRKPVIASELLASRRPFQEGIYVVGPFAGRVSFSSQQRRSMSLVGEIDADIQSAGDIRGLKDKKVCIVGAGLAGLTCAATVAALGAKAYIYDRSLQVDVDVEVSGDDDPESENGLDLGRVMATIRSASHRDAHPNLNFWPYEEVEPFTRFPFLNWHEGNCQSVATQILGDLKRLQARRDIGNRIVGVRNGYEVKRIVRPEGHPKKWVLECNRDPSAEEDWVVKYDIVILATGFGLETSAPGLKTEGYWISQGDPVAQIAKRPPRAFKHYVVSGTGDGGLIEALRLTFKDKRAGNIDPTTMRAIGDLTFRNSVSMIENAAYKLFIDHALHDPDGKLSNESRNKIATFLWDEYVALLSAGEFSDDVIKALTRTRSELPYVELLGQWTYPMELSASPYHRMLIVLSIQKNWIKYTQISKVSVSNENKPVTVISSGAPIEVPMVSVILEIPPKKKKRTRVEIRENAFFVARHGYNSPIAELWPDEEPKFRRQQLLYADQDQLKPALVERLSKAYGRANPHNSKEFFQENIAPIHKYFIENYGLFIRLEEEDPSSPKFIVTRDFKLKPQKDKALPVRLFELEILDREQPRDLRAYPGVG